MQEITYQQAQELSSKYDNAWQDPSIPRKQYDLCVRNELEKYKQGASMKTFDVFVQCLLKIPDIDNLRLLEIGASSGYYREVLRTAGFKTKYTALDYSEAFHKLALELWPDIEYLVEDARAIPSDNKSWDVVVSAASLMHIIDYEKAFSEAVRVADKYVVLHRTPIRKDGQTKYYLKEAYGVECLEVHFDLQLIYGLMSKYGLEAMYHDDIFWNDDMKYGHRTFLCQKI